MKKRDTVKSNALFNKIIENGEKKKSKYYIICSMEKDFIKNNYGIAVGTKVGNAVVRNKIKRQMRNIIDKNIKLFPNYHNYIIICKREITNLSFQEMENQLIRLLNNKGEKHEK